VLSGRPISSGELAQREEGSSVWPSFVRRTRNRNPDAAFYPRRAADWTGSERGPSPPPISKVECGPWSVFARRCDRHGTAALHRLPSRRPPPELAVEAVVSRLLSRTTHRRRLRTGYRADRAPRPRGPGCPRSNMPMPFQRIVVCPARGAPESCTRSVPGDRPVELPQVGLVRQPGPARRSGAATRPRRRGGGASSKAMKLVTRASSCAQLAQPAARPCAAARSATAGGCVWRWRSGLEACVRRVRCPRRLRVIHHSHTKPILARPGMERCRRPIQVLFVDSDEEALQFAAQQRFAEAARKTVGCAELAFDRGRSAGSASSAPPDAV